MWLVKRFTVEATHAQKHIPNKALLLGGHDSIYLMTAHHTMLTEEA